MEHRSRAAGKDHALGAHGSERGLRVLIGNDLAIDFLLAHPPGDELGHLRAEIDDEYLVVHGSVCSVCVARISVWSRRLTLSDVNTPHHSVTASSAAARSLARIGVTFSTAAAPRRNTDTKKPSVSVRRGVIKSPSSAVSAARAKIDPRSPSGRTSSAAESAVKSAWRARKLRIWSPFSSASREQVT